MQAALAAAAALLNDREAFENLMHKPDAVAESIPSGATISGLPLVT